ncbi:MAG: esterase family protein [Oscillospiraceae bacterium]|jgi:enterochelin esterase-like enzyme|nr:esterase family protein [Oscillospiraceae bacterium]
MSSYVNPPAKSMAHVLHKTFYSRAYQQELGYNIYLPSEYNPLDTQKRYAVQYHLHGFQEDESTDVAPMLPAMVRGHRIVVLVNNTPMVEGREDFYDEEMLIDELIPLIDREYNTIPTREGRCLSGFSMGGNMAFCYAVQNRAVFSSVVAYAGTYHHSFSKEPQTVGMPREKAGALYDEMLRAGCDVQAGHVLCLIRENADWLRCDMDIELRVGSDDILICDNEIVHMHLDALGIPHGYQVFDGVAHWLGGLV